MLGLGRLRWVGRSGSTQWNNPTNLTDPTGFVADGFWSNLISGISNFFGSEGGSQTTSKPSNEGSQTGGADNTGGQGKPSQSASTVIITGSLANARFEQWLLAETIKAIYEAKRYAARVAPVARAAIVRAAPRAIAAQAFHEVPIVGQAIGIAGAGYLAWEVGQAMLNAGNGEGDTSAEDALDAGSGTNSASGSPPPDGEDPQDDKAKRITNEKHHPNSKSPEPKNADKLYENSVVDKNGVRWAKDTDGTLHRFSKPSNGETHWNGSTSGPKPIRLDNVPPEIKRLFGVKG